MSQNFRKRIRRIDKHLQFFLTENDNYHLGLQFEDYLKSPFLDNYGLPKQFTQNKILVPAPKGSVTKSNQNGYYVRMEPEEKETIIRHIDYIRRKDNAHIKYDREYYIYKKVLLHQFKTGLYFVINQHGQQLVVSELLNYSNKDSLRGTHIANIFNEIFNLFEVYDDKLNPAIHFNTKFEQIILPSGKLDNPVNFENLIDIGKRFSKNDDVIKAFQKRLQVLKEYNPDIRGKGSKGFFGYIVFGFTDLNIVILETMYAGNATYVFSLENFEQQVIKDKQTVLNDKIQQARFFHHDNWELNIRKFMNDKIKNE